MTSLIQTEERRLRVKSKLPLDEKRWFFMHTYKHPCCIITRVYACRVSGSGYEDFWNWQDYSSGVKIQHVKRVTEKALKAQHNEMLVKFSEYYAMAEEHYTAQEREREEQRLRREAQAAVIAQTTSGILPINTTPVSTALFVDEAATVPISVYMATAVT